MSFFIIKRLLYLRRNLGKAICRHLFGGTDSFWTDFLCGSQEKWLIHVLKFLWIKRRNKNSPVTHQSGHEGPWGPSELHHICLFSPTQHLVLYAQLPGAGGKQKSYFVCLLWGELLKKWLTCISRDTPSPDWVGSLLSVTVHNTVRCDGNWRTEQKQKSSVCYLVHLKPWSGSGSAWCS